MQAALDLADSGYKVYLVEKETSIGGKMAQLDKTFPSNDCAMCILAPRLVSVGRHLNIEIIPNANLHHIDGISGNFEVTLRRRATFIDPNLCTGCGECVQYCPIEVPNEFNLSLDVRRAIAKRYPQAVPAQFAISKRERPPCQLACPAGANVQGYVALTAARKFEEALALLRERMLFANVCGRICNHRCEQECNRNLIDQPVAIMYIKRFLADYDFEHKLPLPPPVEKTRPEKIAVIGGGPAGLTAAHALAKLGYPVTLFEAMPKLGGMLRTGIPRFRLPEDRLDRDIEYLLYPGIDICTNQALGKDFTLADLERQGYRAVFLATGAHKSKRLPIPGADLDGIMLNMEFLSQARTGEPLALAGKVLVIGGGNVAMDVARTVRRLGIQDVTMACLESYDTMPAHRWEIQDAEAEGIKIINDTAFKRFLGKDGHVTGVECIKISFMAFDAEGRLTIKEIPGTEFIIPADRIIVAIGQGPDLSYLTPQDEVAPSRRGLLPVNPDTLGSGRMALVAAGERVPTGFGMGIFAGGDVITGTAFVVDAVRAGHLAAESIHCFLQGEPLPEHREKPPLAKLEPEVAEHKLRTGEIKKLERTLMPTLTLEERLRGFAEIDLGYTEELAVREAQRCLACGICSECLQCVAHCEMKAINHFMPREQLQKLQVGAVILAPGFEVFNPESKPEYGYKRFPNVITSMEFERVLSPTGPFAGKVRRPGDGKAPKKVAFIQCVGSREVERNYCSSVCCMYTTKQAIIAKEHEPGLDCTIFYIDIRSFAKGFEQYIERAKREGVHYIRCRPSQIRENPATRDLIVEYVTEDGRLHTDTFNMVVLSVGLEPPAGARELAAAAGIELNEFGFCRTSPFSPVETTRPGVFVCGPFAEPMDIPETVAQASAAAAQAMTLLADSRNTLVRKKEYPPERDVRGEEPRIGVFICHCGTNIGGFVDVPSVVEYAQTLPNVVYAERNLYTCSDDTQKRIREKIDELKLNRVVVASCTPRTHEVLFRDTVREAGLNPYYFEMANIRDQCSWVHMHEPEKATEKAKDLVRIAVAKTRLTEALYPRPLSVNNDALVIGGGIAGMTSALELAEQGFTVHLVERQAELGGGARRLRYLLNGDNPADKLRTLIERVHAQPRIKLHTESKLAEVSGSIGNFHSKIASNGSVTEIDHGIIVVATGAQPYQPKEFLYGQDDHVLVNQELEERLARGSVPGQAVAFIQCVGSRCPERPWCSRTCCTETIKNALKLKERQPETRVYVLYRDIRAYGFREAYYRKAREQGVIFIRYADDKPPEVARHNGRLRIRVEDQMVRHLIELDTDWVVLAAATVPNESNQELGQLLKVPLSEEKFFLEAHRKLRPIDFASDGIFLCGAAHSPFGLEEAMAQAAGTASRAATILSKKVIDLEPTISHVVDERCDGCAYCVDPCPFKAITLIEYSVNGETKKRVEVNEALCKGCGNCMATCPKNAIFVWHFRPEQLSAMVRAALNLPT